MNARRRRRLSCLRPIAAALLLLALCRHPADALDATRPDGALACAQPGAVRTMGRQIRLQSDGPGNTRRILQEAVAMWSSCRGYGDVLPRFVTSGPAFRVVHVRFLRSSPSGVCGQFSSDTILLYASAHDRRGRRVPCDRLANNLAHELGHVLGLLDAPTDPACGHVIMAQDDLRLARRVDARECTAAATRWLADDAGRAADAPRR